MQATIVMPNNAPLTKKAATLGYGAKVVEYDPVTTKREELAARLAAEGGQTVIPPYDHLDVIAGQGTAVLEMFDELKTLDTLLVCCGGGGLLSGSAIASKGKDPHCNVVGVEPEVANVQDQNPAHYPQSTDHRRWHTHAIARQIHLSTRA